MTSPLPPSLLTSLLPPQPPTMSPFASPLSQYSDLGSLSLTGLLTTLYPPTPPVTPQPIRWVAVRQRFEQFHRNLLLTVLQQEDGLTKRNGVVSCLNRHYYGMASN